MLIQPYLQEELKFAWCNRVFFRVRTHRRQAIDSLASLEAKALEALVSHYGIHVLEFSSSAHEIRGLLSLKPTEAISTAISKTKGRISKWLTDKITNTPSRQKPLATGYFAITVGQSEAAAIDEYLEKQAEHHEYVDRVRPPVFCRSIAYPEVTRQTLYSDHSVTFLRYHLVFTTPYRRGVFTDESADRVADCWLEIQQSFLIDKVSFLPDHVHVAVSVHPTVAPAVVVCALLNRAQETMWSEFSSLVVKARIDRLWQASAYIGSFGDLSSSAVAAYMQSWSASKCH